MSATSISAYAIRHQQHSLEHSLVVRNLPPSLVSHQHLSRTIYLASPPPRKDTCADTDLTPPPREILKTTLSQHVQRSITCSPNTKFAPCETAASPLEAISEHTTSGNASDMIMSQIRREERRGVSPRQINAVSPVLLPSLQASELVETVRIVVRIKVGTVVLLPSLPASVLWTARNVGRIKVAPLAGGGGGGGGGRGGRKHRRPVPGTGGPGGGARARAWWATATDGDRATARRMPPLRHVSEGGVYPPAIDRCVRVVDGDGSNGGD